VKRPSIPEIKSEEVVPSIGTSSSAKPDTTEQHAEALFEPHPEPSVRSRLLGPDNWDAASGCGSENCAHGTLSPRPNSPRPGSTRSYGSFASENGFGGPYPGGIEERYAGGAEESGALLGNADGVDQGSTTRWLARRHGVKGRRRMYIAYYVPFFNWVRQYKWQYIQGDLVAALTMASFYIPMSLSYAANLGHVPPVNGLYAFVFNPLIYAVLGTCPQMVVGPEAAGSLLTGQVVRENIEKGKVDDGDQAKNAQIAGIVTFIAGFVILLAGIFRLGFLDNVLSRPFLRGFISAIGIVIFVDQLIPELGLDERAAHTAGVAHGSTLDKAIFIVQNGGYAHALTTAISFGSFSIILVCRYVYHPSLKSQTYD
jgi:Sulfate permease family